MSGGVDVLVATAFDQVLLDRGVMIPPSQQISS